jgi:hypothetical protein
MLTLGGRFDILLEAMASRSDHEGRDTKERKEQRSATTLLFFVLIFVKPHGPNTSNNLKGTPSDYRAAVVAWWGIMPPPEISGKPTRGACSV